MKKFALVTGATSGIGKAMAEKFAQQKHNLILVSKANNIDVLNRQADVLAKQHDIEVLAIAADLEKKDAARTVYEAVKALGVHVQILVNNAGFGVCGLFVKTDLTHEINMIHVHAICTTEMTKLFLPDMVTNGCGRIMNIASTSAYTPVSNMAVYAATKAYIDSFSKAVNMELKGTGVTVTVVSPGATHTGFIEKAGMENTLLFRLFVMRPEAVADVGYKAMMRGKRCVVAGIYNKLLTSLSGIMPLTVKMSIAKVMTDTERNR